MVCSPWFLSLSFPICELLQPSVLKISHRRIEGDC
jgi:hypothetical protein